MEIILWRPNEGRGGAFTSPEEVCETAHPLKVDGIYSGVFPAASLHFLYADQVH